MGAKVLIYFILKGLIISLILTIIIVLLKDTYLEFIFSWIKQVRGTEKYEGETKAEELYIILTRIIVPTIMIIVFAFLLKIRGKSRIFKY